MIPNFDPTTAEFTQDIDPITADRQALAVLDMLDNSVGLAPNRDEVLSGAVDEKRNKLITSLQKYKGYKEQRGEPMFSFDQEAIARSKTESADVTSHKLKNIFAADDKTFNSFVDEQGDRDMYDRFAGFMPQGKSMRGSYLKDKAMQMFGFSEREIRSGFAEPQMRELVGAGEHEPTEDAVNRWSIRQADTFDRRKSIENSAFTNANVSFLGMTDDQNVDAFEKLLEKSNPDLTDDERTVIRAIRNTQYDRMEKEHGKLRPLVKKAFNTIMSEDSAEDVEKGARFADGRFASMDEAAMEFAKLPEDKFDVVVAMLAETAKAHGRDVDGFMNNMAAAFERGFDSSFGMASRQMSGMKYDQIAESLKDRKTKIEVPANWTADDAGKILKSMEVLYRPSFSSMPGGDTSGLGAMFERKSNIKDGYGEDADKPMRNITPEEREAAMAKLGEVDRANKYTSQLVNWKEKVAKINKGSWYSPKNWAYGLTQSVPEMAMSINAGGWGIIFMAESERRETAIREEKGRMQLTDTERSMAATQAAGYTAMAAFEGKILFGKMPFTKSFAGSFFTRVGAETIQEVGQDSMASLTQKLYHTMGQDVEDVNLFTDGNLWDNLTKEGGEISNIIREAPRVAFTVAPLVLLSVGGQKVADKMDQKALARLMKNRPMLELMNLDHAEIDSVVSMNTSEAVEYLNQRYKDTGLSINKDPILSRPVTSSDGVQVSVNPDGTFTVSHVDPAKPGVATQGDTQMVAPKTIIARTPEEAAEAAKSLNPAAFKRHASVVEAEYVERTNPTPVRDNTINQGDLDDYRHRALGFASKLSREDPVLVSEAMPPVPNDPVTGGYSRMAKFRYRLQSFLESGRKLPSRSLDEIRVKAGRQKTGYEQMSSRIALQLEKQVGNLVKNQAPAARQIFADNLRTDMGNALHGDNVALNNLPPDVRDTIQSGRDFIDKFSQDIAQYMPQELRDTLKDNVGKYVFRQFRVNDTDANWNYTTVRRQHPAIYDAAHAYLKATGLTDVEADQAIREMLDPAKAQDILMGNASAGKASVTSLIKRKDLAPEILDLLGEVRDPVINIRESGRKVSEMAVTYDAQADMASWLIRAKFGSRTIDGRKNVLLGGESVPTIKYNPDMEDNGQIIYTQVVGKAFRGFGQIYVEPELAEAMTEAFTARAGQLSPWEMLGRSVATISAFGKFNQVILNPGAYPVNFMGGLGQEIASGRMFTLNADGLKALAKFGTSKFRDLSKAVTYGIKEQSDFYNAKVGAYLKKGGADQLTWNQMESEMQIGGLLDQSVLGKDFSDTVKSAFGDKVSGTRNFLAKGYQMSDNAWKRAALATEFNKWLRALPADTNVKVAWDNAVEDVRATTQNYDLVPHIIKLASQRGVVVPTYVSFFYELLRGTKNNVMLAGKEIKSGNPVLVANGFKRVAGLSLMGMAMYGLTNTLTNMLTGMTHDEKERLREGLEPWFSEKEMVFTRADDKELAYFDPSYLIPYGFFYNAVFSVPRGGDDFVESLTDGLGEMNIFTQTAVEVLANEKKQGGKIYNPAVDDGFAQNRKKAEHIYKSMFTPGFVRLFDRAQKSAEGSVGYGGSVNRWDDLALQIIGVRMYRKDTSSPRFVVDNVRDFNALNRTIKSALPEWRKDEMTPEDLQKAQGDIDIATARMVKKFDATIGMFKQLGLSEDRVLEGLKEANVSKDLRSRASEIMK